jgi:hypothetical protein
MLLLSELLIYLFICLFISSIIRYVSYLLIYHSLSLIHFDLLTDLFISSIISLSTTETYHDLLIYWQSSPGDDQLIYLLIYLY